MSAETTLTTEQQTQARRRIEARRKAMAARISDIGRAENQSVSAEVLEVAHEEIAQLQRRINELEEQAESFKVRIANQETVIRVQAETIARMEAEQSQTLEMLKDGNRAHVMILKGDIYLTRRQLAHLLGDAYQDLFNALENTPQNPLCPKEPLLPPETANVPDTQKWAGGWKNLRGWKVPDADGLHIRINGDVLEWRNSIESGWVPAEKWDEPVAVHTAPNVRRAGGK